MFIAPRQRMYMGSVAAMRPTGREVDLARLEASLRENQTRV